MNLTHRVKHQIFFYLSSQIFLLGPSSYDVKSKPFKPKIEHPTANFVSSTAREVIVEVTN
jgi:hypothetical protein